MNLLGPILDWLIIVLAAVTILTAAIELFRGTFL